MKLIQLILVCCASAVVSHTSAVNECDNTSNRIQCDSNGDQTVPCLTQERSDSSTDHCLTKNDCQPTCNSSPVESELTSKLKPEPIAEPESVPEVPSQAEETSILKPEIEHRSMPGCGDKFCDNRSETCFNCPSDCGTCQPEHLESCVQPGAVTLTFNDGPTENTPNLLRTANELGVTLTHFILGKNLANKSYQTFLKQCYDAGHIIASHTFSHPNITDLTDGELRQEIIKTDDAIFDVIGKRPVYIRTPYFDTDERTMAIIHSMGYKHIFASLDSEDMVYGLKEPSRILTNIINGLDHPPAHGGHVIAQHEIHNVSTNYLPQIVQEIKKRQIDIIPITECFENPNVYRNDVCGDGQCTGYIENCETCPQDCGRCPEPQ